MSLGGITIRRGHVLAIVLANAVLWVAAVFVTGEPKLGGPGAIALISIASLLFVRPRTA